MSNEKLIDLFEVMVTIRFFEEEATRQFDEAKIPGVLHVSLGQEAIAAGVCGALEENDYVISTHRGHGHAIAKGTPPGRVFAELMAKSTGCCKGIGGSMHNTYLKRGVLFCTAIVGGGIPIAVGAGLSIRMDKKTDVVACFFGEGAANTGAFHEGLNLAALWNVPVIFVCENNLYALSTSVKKSTLKKDIAEKASAYGMSGVIVDGNDVEKMYLEAVKAVDRARRGDGPTLIECKTYRWTGHNYKFDPGEYRPDEEVASWKARDPVNILEKRLVEKGILDREGLEGIYDKVKSEIVEAVKFAVESPYPTPDMMKTYLYV